MAETNFSVYRGNTVPLTITVMNGAVAQNITGYTFYFTAKKLETDTDAQAKINKKITTLSDPTHGIFIITLLTTDTNLDTGNYLYDIVAQSGATPPVITTLFYGTLTIMPRVRITMT